MGGGEHEALDAIESGDLKRAARTLLEGGFTVVAVKGEEVLTDIRKGVAPLLGWIDSGRDMSGFCIADKVVGKGPALLYCLMGVEAVYAPVMSVDGRRVLLERGIEALCEKTADWIANRTGDGRCPIDSSVVETEDPEEALGVIRNTVSKLSAQGR